jgi:predicted methyltransferase
VRINPLFPAKRFKEKNYITCYYPYTDSITEFKKVGQNSLTHPAGKGSSFGFGRTTGVCCGVPFTEKQNKFQENLNMKFFQKQQCSICGSQSVQIFIDLYKH